MTRIKGIMTGRPQPADLRSDDPVDHSNCKHHGRYHSCLFCQQLRDKFPEQYQWGWENPAKTWSEYVEDHLQWFIDFHGHEPPSIEPIQERLQFR